VKLYLKVFKSCSLLSKDNPSWILMLNIQAGIRNAVGKNARLIKEHQVKDTDDISKKKEFMMSPKDLRFPPYKSFDNNFLQ
jgi:hypothetical protein